jgi:ABC-type phosphate transport system substrate-binding protein
MAIPSWQTSASAEEKLEVVIIANEKVPEKVFSKKDIKDIFLGNKSKFKDDKKIVLATLKDGETHKVFLKDYVSKTTSQYSTYWKKLVFTGKGKQPEKFKTEKELVDFVNKTEGAIGYISSKTEAEKATVITVK